MSVADEHLVREALSGSQSAYRELVHRFERPVFNLVARMIRDRAAAEDVAQDAFVKAFNRLETFREDQGKFSNWLFKIAHNTAIDQLRRSSLDTISLDAREEDELAPLDRIADTGTPSPYDRAFTTDLGAALEAAIERLRPEYREVVVLRHQEGLAYEEVAGVMGLPLGTVKTYLHRARKEMAALLTAAGWGPDADPAFTTAGVAGQGETATRSLS